MAMIPLLHVCPPEWHEILATELATDDQFSDAEGLALGWISSNRVNHRPAVPGWLASALQTLPNPKFFEYSSVQSTVRSVVAEIKATVPRASRWTLHVTSAWNSPEVSRGRAKLIRDHVLRELSQRRNNEGPFSEENWLVQVGLVSRQQFAVSILAPESRREHDGLIWPVAGGVVHQKPDRRPPSRAYAKLREALALMNEHIQPGQYCVDLGASPGGWTFDFAVGGAQVTAVDRSPLRDDLMTHPHVQFVRGDAFRYVPERVCDWLVYDVAAFPERTLDLLGKWLENSWCQRAIVTVKFTGERYVEAVGLVKARLACLCRPVYLRRLLTNKNEVAVMVLATSASCSLDKTAF
jgi:23S rRNA (cytidine2498-2'-O)-methyltransferase